jgi:zinc transporter
MISVEELCRQIEAGHGPETTGDFLSRLAERLIYRMQSLVSEIEDHVLEIEEESHLEGAQKHRSAIADLRRQSTSLRRYLKPQLEAMVALQDTEIVLLDDRHRARLHETANHLTRYIEELESLRERAAITQEELAANVAEQLSNRMYVLSIVAAIFLPLGFLTGLLGVNVAGIPGADNDAAFLLFCLLLATLSAAQIALFRLKHWF